MVRVWSGCGLFYTAWSDKCLNQELCLLPFFDSNSTIDDLKCERTTYIAEAKDISSQTEKTDWWKRKADKLPKWANACKKVLLLQPSSAAAERVFSVLSNSFSNRQEHAVFERLHTNLCYDSVQFKMFIIVLSLILHEHNGKAS